MKKIYVSPKITCFQVMTKQTLLLGSGDQLGVDYNETLDNSESLSRRHPNSVWDDDEEGEW